MIPIPPGLYLCLKPCYWLYPAHPHHHRYQTPAHLHGPTTYPPRSADLDRYPRRPRHCYPASPACLDRGKAPGSQCGWERTYRQRRAPAPERRGRSRKRGVRRASRSPDDGVSVGRACERGKRRRCNRGGSPGVRLVMLQRNEKGWAYGDVTELEFLPLRAVSRAPAGHGRGR
jgi:hypothetical protein